MTTTIYSVMQRDSAEGSTWICVGTKTTERAAKLLRTKLRGDSDREYQIIPLTVEPK